MSATPRANRATRTVWRLSRLGAAFVLGLGALVSAPAAAAPPVTAQAATVSPVPTADLAQAKTPNPVVDKHGFATFTYRSTTAKSVSVVGGFGPSDASMTWSASQTSSGVFTAVVGPLKPGLYNYTLSVDGVDTVDPSNPNVVHSAPTHTLFLVAGKSERFLTKKKVKHGALTTLTYHSDVTGSDRKATVWTPPGYPRRGVAYPTFYLVHGGGGDYLDWVQQGRANIILDNLYAARRIERMVVVMVDGNVPGSTGTPSGDKFIPEVLDNLAPAVRSAYQVSHSRKDQALAGLSLGGLQAFNMLLVKPGEFRYVGDFSSGYFPHVIADLHDSDLLSKANVKQVNKKTVLFRIYIGNKVDIAYNNNVATRALFDMHGVRYRFNGVYLKSGHTWRTWQHDLHDFAPRIF